MGAEEKFDVIVVGGGPAGLTAAYVMAKAGLQVVVLERGDYCGSKNMFGGVFFTNVLRELIPDFEKDAPLERVVTKRRWSLLTPDGEIGGGFKFSKFAQQPHNNSYTVLRAKFDKWFSEKTEEAGAMILTGCVVDGFLRDEKGKINGVKARMDDGDIYADCVILADGVNSLLAKQLEMHKELAPECTIVGIKEVIEFPEEKIMDRFGLNDGEGVAYEYFGYAAKGAIGSGFIYTNKNTISVGVGGTIKSLMEHKINPNDLLEWFKSHPAIKPLVNGGEQREYAAHLIPDGGYNKLSKLYKDNVLVVGDAAGFVNASLFHEGTNLAMMSGKLAGETVVKAKEAVDYSEAMTARYEHRLRESFVMKDMKKFRHLAHVLDTTPQLFEKYPVIMEEFVRDMFTVDGESKNAKQMRLVMRLLRKENPISFALTGLKGRRVII